MPRKHTSVGGGGGGGSTVQAAFAELVGRPRGRAHRAVLPGLIGLLLVGLLVTFGLGVACLANAAGESGATTTCGLAGLLWPMGGVALLVLPVCAAGFLFANVLLAYSKFEHMRQFIRYRVFLGVRLCIGCGCVAACFLLMGGVFLGLNWPEIKQNEAKYEAKCTILDSTVAQYQSCTESPAWHPSQCRGCAPQHPSCGALLAQTAFRATTTALLTGDRRYDANSGNATAGTCCGERKCCQTICDKCCDDDTNSGCIKCNCRCTHSVNTIRNVYCRKGYEVHISLLATLTLNGEQQQLASVGVEDFKKDKVAAESYAATEAAPRTTLPCWLEASVMSSARQTGKLPARVGIPHHLLFEWHFGYSYWKWLLFALPALFLCALLVLCVVSLIVGGVPGSGTRLTSRQPDWDISSEEGDASEDDEAIFLGVTRGSVDVGSAEQVVSTAAGAGPEPAADVPPPAVSEPASSEDHATLSVGMLASAHMVAERIKVKETMF